MSEQVEVPQQVSPGEETVAEFRARVRAWLAEHVPRKVPGEPFLQWDDEGVARDRAVQRSLWEGGIAGVHLPREYGGLGLSAAHQEAFREEAADHRMPENFGNAFNVVIPTLLAHGTEELKRRHIPPILRGDAIWCQFLSEPSGGSDLAGLLTRAEPTEGGFVLNGAKIWTTGGNYSDWAICLARTNPDVPKHAGLTMFVVDMRSAGILVSPVTLLDGTADFCQEQIDDVFVPAENVVGEVDDGWRVATTLMVNERSAIGRGWSLGGQQGQQEESGIGLDPTLLELARAVGRDADPGVRGLIGERWVLNAVMAATTRRVGAAITAGDLPGPAAAILKAMAGAVGPRNGEIDLAVAGARAAAWPAGSAERWGHHRLSSHGIGGGTTEMQRNAIAERLLGLPREPSDDRVVPFRAAPPEHPARVTAGTRDGSEVHAAPSPTASPTPSPSASATDADTRDRILRAGMDCVTRYGRAKTTMRDVAVAAGLSRATLYRYFTDRGALFNGIREFERERDHLLITERAERTRTLPEAVAVVAEVLAATGTRYRMGEHLAAGDESLARFLSLRMGRERERVASLVRPYVERAAATGELRAGVTAVEAEEWIALSLAQAGSLTGLRAVDVHDPAAVGRWLARMTCAGICADH